MSTNVLTQHSASPGIVPSAGKLRISKWTIAMALSINTNVRRIFQALTVPEYQEAWFSMPGHGPDCHLSASRTTECFRIDRHRGDRIDLSIVGSYRTCRRGKLCFTWQKHAASNFPESLVQIRLYGDFGRSTLRLHHDGLVSRAEYLWHQEMWEMSLAKLAALF